MKWKSVIILFLIAGQMLLSACKKNRADNNNYVNQSGKWVSVSFYNGSQWVTELMPHHFNFRTDMSFDFRESGGPNCSGQYSVKYNSNSSNLIKFLSPGCGLTDRIAENITADTLVLTVVNPPNITKNKVKYAREP